MFEMDLAKLDEFGFGLLTRMWGSTPLKDWYEERRVPLIWFIDAYSKQFPERVKWIRRDLGPARVFVFIKFVVGKVTYIYLEEMDVRGSVPLIQWFQLEAVTNTLPNKVFTTRLVLASDDSAITQGGPWLKEIEEEEA